VDDAAARLGRLIGPLRRAVLRSRHAENLPDLPEAQIELLRALQQAGTSTPSSISTHLRIAPSTVSNLVREMTDKGLVLRSPSATDLRHVHLSLTPTAADMLDRYDRVSTAALRTAMQSLSPQRRKALEACLPAIADLITALTEQRDDSPSPPRRAPGRIARDRQVAGRRQSKMFETRLKPTANRSS
jgi:DNA-binding MarR family transcriptional regulator